MVVICLGIALAIILSINIWLYTSKNQLKSTINKLKEELSQNSATVSINYYIEMGATVFGIYNKTIIACKVNKVVQEKDGIYVYGKDITADTEWKSRIDGTFTSIEEARVKLDKLIDADIEKRLQNI